MKNKNLPIGLLISVLSVFSGYAQNINIHSIADARMPGGTDYGYTLDGYHMNTSSTPKLLNTDNFGPSGTYPKTVSIVSGYADSNSLAAINGISGIDLFFFGSFDKNNVSLIQFTDAELDSLYNWSMSGGKMIIGGSANAPGVNFNFDILNSRWGFGVEYVGPGGGVLAPVFTSADSILASGIFNRPFGSFFSANQGGSIRGTLNVIPNNSVVLGVDLLGNPTLVLDCKTLDLILADNDGFTDLGGVSQGPTITTDNDKFWANTIAYMDALQSPPAITQNGNTLSTGAYSSYQWYQDGNAISGATSASYTASSGGTYHVEVSLDCGCDSVASKAVTAFGVGINPVSSGVSELTVHPNPVSAASIVSFDLKKSETVSVGIYDIAGKEIKNLYSGNLPAGKQQIDLNIGATPNQAFQNGVYLIKITGENIFASKKIVLVN